VVTKFEWFCVLLGLAGIVGIVVGQNTPVNLQHESPQKVDFPQGIRTTILRMPFGTPLEMVGACETVMDAEIPPVKHYTLFLNKDNDCHLSIKDSAGTVTDLQRMTQ
jgi:hypothetical protein